MIFRTRQWRWNTSSALIRPGDLADPEARYPWSETCSIHQILMGRRLSGSGRLWAIFGSWDGTKGAAQHTGLGRKLIEKAQSIASSGYQRLAVISAVGTRAYYAARGFVEGSLYMVKDI